MEQGKYFLELRNRLFKSPNSGISLGTVFAIMIVYELIIKYKISAFLSLFVIPYLILLLLDVIFLKIFKQYFPFIRISLLNEIVFIISFVAYLILSIFFLKNTVVALLLAFSMSGFFRYLFLKPFLTINEKKIFFVSLFYTFSIAIPYVYSDKSLYYLIPFFISSVTFVFASRIFISYMSKEFKEEFDLDPVKYVGYFINYVSLQRPEEMFSLNNFLSKMYSVMEIPLQVVSIKDNDKIKGILIFPYVHPGPFGEVGCSDLPRRLLNKLNDISENILVFHTSSTHNENCGGEEDIEKIAKAIRENIGKIKYNDKISEVIRIDNKISIRAQVINDTALVTLIPTKIGFDDVTLELGMKIMRKLKTSKIKNVIIIDAHNHFDESYKALDDIDQELISKLKSKLNNIKFEKMRCGIGSKKFIKKSIGPMGVQVLIFQNEKRIGYILIDGNNVKKGIREEILRRFSDKFDDLEVYSTDNHIVNINPKDLNPIGNEESNEDLYNAIEESINMAMSNLEYATFGFFETKLILKIAGKGYLDKVTFYVRRMVKRLRISILVVILTFIFSLIIFIISFIFIG